MFYVQTRTYRARVGPIAKSKTETCEHCHKTHEIVAQAWGEGSSVAMYDFSGGRATNQEAAFEAARRNATLTADSALRVNPCPACGRVATALLREGEAAQQAHRRRLRLATFVPLACGALALLPFGLGPMRALAYSAWPLGSALAVAGGVAALVLATLLWPRRNPLRATTATLFYRPVPAESAYRGDGPEEAFLPWPAMAKYESSFGSLSRGVGAVVTAMALLGFASYGLSAQATRFDAIHIVSMAPPGTKIRVSQPGLGDQVFEVRASHGDAFHVMAKVLRLAAPHPLTVTEEGKTPYTASLTLPALKSRSETIVLTLGAAAAGKCLAFEKAEEGLTPQPPSDVHPDLVFARSYASTWLARPSASKYASAYRLLPCADARAREVQIASLAEPGTKIVVSQTGKADQEFTVGTHAGSDAFLLRARVYESDNGRFTVREDGSDYAQAFRLPTEAPSRNPYETKPTWLIVAGASAQRKCVGIFVSQYGDERLGLGALRGDSPPFRTLVPAATDLWSVPPVDVWFADTPKTVTGSRFQNLTRTSVRIKDCAVLDVLSRFGTSKAHDPRDARDADTGEDTGDEGTRARGKPFVPPSGKPGMNGGLETPLRQVRR